MTSRQISHTSVSRLLRKGSVRLILSLVKHLIIIFKHAINVSSNRTQKMFEYFILRSCRRQNL